LQWDQDLFNEQPNQFAKVIDRESNKIDRWICEAIHIRKKRDKLMNRDEGSFQLPHIYDYVLSATATPGGQSFR